MNKPARTTQSDKLIQCYGLRWKKDDVYWGEGGQGNAGVLWGCRKGHKGIDVDFRDQIGIYILYANERVVYVGQTGSKDQKLFGRLNKHRNTDHLVGRWDSFSWFGLRGVTEAQELAEVKNTKADLGLKLKHFEAVLIAIIEPPLNKQGGAFGDGCHEYFQTRHEHLDEGSAVNLLTEAHEKLDSISQQLNQLKKEIK